MIPKVIHYCWFGGKPLPESAKNCIQSWHRYLPDYEIHEWNESNFDLNCCEYVREAYEAQKWAFVSDYARFWILYHNGGLYFDTDVELIRPIDDIIHCGSFMGCESIDPTINTSNHSYEDNSESFIWPIPGLSYGVNPGLGLGAVSGLELFEEILDLYHSRHFSVSSPLTVVAYTTSIMLRHGWSAVDFIQTVQDITIYPPEYFCPMNYNTGVITFTNNTRSIHYYTATWMSPSDRRYHRLTVRLQNMFGRRIGTRIGRIIDFPHRVCTKISLYGIRGTIRFILSR